MLEKLSKYPTLGSVPTLGVVLSTGYGYRYEYRSSDISKEQDEKKDSEGGKTDGNS